MATKQQAIAALTATPTSTVVLVDRDATGDWFTRSAAWLDSDGELVIAHPTDERRGPISAPNDGRYEIS